MLVPFSPFEILPPLLAIIIHGCWAEAVLQEAVSDLTADEALFLRSAVAHSAAFGLLRLPSILSYFSRRMHREEHAALFMYISSY